MISTDTIQSILGLQEKVHLSPKEMQEKLIITFYPDSSGAGNNLINFSERLREGLINLNVKVIPYSEAWEGVSYKKRLRRFVKYLLNNAIWVFKKIIGQSQTSFLIPFSSILKLSAPKRIKKGVSIICVGERDLHDLPMQFISSFKTNSIITIVDFPKDINKSIKFATHFDIAMSLFAYHMSNIILAVDEERWIIYNFNLSHPIYDLHDGKIEAHLMSAFIPKLVAPISPYKMNEFVILEDRFDSKDYKHASVVKEMVEGSRAFSMTGLYPAGKKVDDLPFRHDFHKLIGKMHLDNRNGMAFGFLAFQMPTEIPQVFTFEDFVKNHDISVFKNSDYYFDVASKSSYLLFTYNSSRFVVNIPEIWVMTLRSGSDKTNFNPSKDLLKMGLNNGKMLLQFPDGLHIDNDYKPSFDTKVILAHAVGNSIIAGVAEYFLPGNKFSSALQKNGISISHWHGYFDSAKLPLGLKMYGMNNPHVSCSSPQSAIYALNGKMENFFDIMNAGYLDTYNGDVHIEPHHGLNISYPSMLSLAQYILDNPGATELGNRFLKTD